MLNSIYLNDIIRLLYFTPYPSISLCTICFVLPNTTKESNIGRILISRPLPPEECPSLHGLRAYGAFGSVIQLLKAHNICSQLAFCAITDDLKKASTEESVPFFSVLSSHTFSVCVKSGTFQHTCLERGGKEC